MMNKYVCHKEVEAARLIGVELYADGTANAWIEHDAVSLDAAAAKRFLDTARGLPAREFYLVRYSGGHLSFSPAKAFEEGYTAVDFSTSEKAAAIREDVRSLWPASKRVGFSAAEQAEAEATYQRIIGGRAPPQWEYAWTTGPTADTMAEIGRSGWEAYAVSESGTRTVYHLKRPLRA